MVSVLTQEVLSWISFYTYKFSVVYLLKIMCPLIEPCKIHLLQAMFVSRKYGVWRFNLGTVFEVDLHLRASLEFFKERKLVLSFTRMQICGNHRGMLVLVKWLLLQENVLDVYRYCYPKPNIMLDQLLLLDVLC
jgi:hypothetical protein